MKKIFLTLLLLSVTLACKQADPEDQNREKILRDISTKVILPGFNRFAEQSTEFKTIIERYLKDPSKSKLMLCQKSWKELAKAWQHCAPFNIGNYKKSMLDMKIGTWPIREKAIQSTINDLATSKVTSLADHPYRVKGIYAIEYLLFEVTLNDKSQNKNSIEEYLSLLVKELNKNAKEAKNLWNEQAEEFIQNSSKERNASLNSLLNEMIFACNKTYLYKIVKPVLKDADSNYEAWRSQYSKELILEDLNVLEACFENGIYEHTKKYDYVPTEPIAARIKEHIENVKTALSKVSAPLSKIADDKRGELTDLMEAQRQLLFLLKAEMSAQCGIQLTFDNDGD